MTYLYWLLEYIISFIESYNCFTFCDMIVHTETPKKTKFIYSILITAFVIILNNISLMSLFLTIILMIIYCFFQVIARKSNILKILLCVILYSVIVFVLDYTFVFALGIVSKENINDITAEMSPIRLAVGLSSKTTLIFFVELLNKIVLKKYVKSKKSDYILIGFTLVITLISTLMYTNLSRKKAFYSEKFLFLCFVIIMGMILTIFIILKYVRENEYDKYELSLIEQQNDLLKKSLSEQEEVFLSWKRSIHDYKNKIIALDGMLKNKRYGEAQKSVETEMELFKDKAFYINTGNITVDILLNNKMNLANSLGISFTFNVSFAEKMKISDIHLSSVLGNLIDNAIEAVQDENEKNVHVQINNINGKLIIKVLNTFTREFITDKSTKNDTKMHGIGLKSVKKNC